MTRQRLLNRLRRGAAIAAVSALAAASAPAFGADLLVDLDQAKIHRLMQPAATVVVGNPSIADVNIQAGDMMVVLGKSPGSTNIIALDQRGREIENIVIHVRQSGNRSVTLYRGSSQLSYNCAPECDRALSIGDAEAEFEVLQRQLNTKSRYSQGEAMPPGRAE